MPRIADSRGRSDENSGYTRLFGNSELGQLISRVQAAVIRAGNELEHILERETAADLKAPLEEILQRGLLTRPEIQVVFQPNMPAIADKRGEKADLAIFDHRNRTVLIIELKDGDTFDTKKSSGELESMTQFVAWITSVSDYSADYYFCSFNQTGKEAIVRGAKGRFDVQHALTGRELCQMLSIDYDLLRQKRQSEQPENLRYFLGELLRISEIRRIVVEMLRGDKTDV